MRILQVLKESKSVKPLGVTLKDGSVAGANRKVTESALMGGSVAFDELMEEEPRRVRDITPKPKEKKAKK